MEEVKCSCCKIFKTREEFYNDKSKKSGRSYVCKICQTKLNKKRKKESPGLIISPKPEEYEKLENLNGNSKNSAYLLGLLWADSSVKPHTSRVELECIKTDIDEIKNVFLKTGDWGYKTRARIGRKPQATLYLTNKAFHNFLLENNYLNKSGGSAKKILDTIPKKHHYLWLRGFFDGDGNFYCKDKTNQLSISGCYAQDWSFMDDFIKGNVCQIKRKNGFSQSTWRICKKLEIIKFINFIYPDFDCDIGFSRKKKLLYQFVQKK